jgi:hypothetical protein
MKSLFAVMTIALLAGCGQGITPFDGSPDDATRADTGASSDGDEATPMDSALDVAMESAIETGADALDAASVDTTNPDAFDVTTVDVPIFDITHCLGHFESCTSGAMCCSHVCDVSGLCTDPLADSGFAVDTGLIDTGRFDTGGFSDACVGFGAPCGSSGACCSGLTCAPGSGGSLVCATFRGDGGTCLGTFESCVSPTECCSGNCVFSGGAFGLCEPLG